MDVLLHRLCLTRSRNEGKTACDTGAISLNGAAARPRDGVLPGARIELRYPRRTLEIEILALPGRSTSRASARELYQILRDETTGGAL